MSNELLVLVKAPTFWPQFITVVAVFIIARELLAPAIDRLLKKLMNYTQREASFNRLWDAILDTRVPTPPG